MARMKYGVNKVLEDEADRLIIADLKKVRRVADKDVLTPWRLKHRRMREQLVPSGTPDGAVRQGMARRAYNPMQTHLNAVDAVGAVRRRREDGLAAFLSEHEALEGE